MHEIVGCIHIHSNYSDGSKSIPEIAKDAESSGLDYIIITDHNTLKSLKDGLERWYNNVLVIIGYEINDSKNYNHYLALGIDDELDKSLTAQQYVEEVYNRGGVGFIAHPGEEREKHPKYIKLPWNAWNAKNFTGMEVWNYMSQWMESLTLSNGLINFLIKDKIVKEPFTRDLEKWDELNKERRVTGIGGIDVHSHIYKLLGIIPFCIFSYKVLFNRIRTHLLLSEELTHNFEHDKRLVLSALKSARCFFSNYKYGDARGFRFTAKGEDGTIAEMGDTINSSQRVDLEVFLPQEAIITLIYNGKPLAHGYGDYFIHTTDKAGIYRVEVRQMKNAWIYSNHIRLEER